MAPSVARSLSRPPLNALIVGQTHATDSVGSGIDSFQPGSDPMCHHGRNASRGPGTATRQLPCGARELRGSRHCCNLLFADPPADLAAATEVGRGIGRWRAVVSAG